MTDKKQNALVQIGFKLLSYAKNELCLNARYLAGAAGYNEEIAQSELEPMVYVNGISTNGSILLFNPDHLLRMFEENPTLLVRTYTHTLFHCIYRHYSKGYKAENPLAWDISADIASEYLIDELKLDCTDREGLDKRKGIYDALSTQIPFISAEYVYELLKDRPSMELKNLKKHFVLDDHILWGTTTPSTMNDGDNSNNEPDEKDGDGALSPTEEGGNYDAKEQSIEVGNFDFKQGSGVLAVKGSDRESMKNSSEDWRRIAERIKLDVESFSSSYGVDTGHLVKTIDVELRTRYDYRNFLKRFMTLKEILREDPTEFDYIYYNLGLTMYGNLPFLDNLEYAVDYSLEEFVIAIDTSGSVYKDLVVRFLEECYSVVEQAQTKRRRIQLHIIQCDSKIKEDEVITGYDDFVRYIKRITVRGGGGTDFRPVFERTDELIKSGKLVNLKGLIYFTDGKGKYPDKPPDYEVAFIFYGKKSKRNDFDCPSWAIKLVIDEEDI